jgi:hypothetical protein
VPAAAATSICTAPRAHASLAAKLSRDIRSALAGRSDTVSVTVADRRTGVVCRVSEGHRYDSASVVKATILATLLRWHQETGRRLTSNEISLATAMITQSDNNAASALWAEVGHSRLQHFLNLAKMTETILGPGGYWGLTQITARDELTLLRLLTQSNRVLGTYSRSFEWPRPRLHDRRAVGQQPHHDLRGEHNPASRQGHPPRAGQRIHPRPFGIELFVRQRIIFRGREPASVNARVFFRGEIRIRRGAIRTI